MKHERAKLLPKEMENEVFSLKKEVFYSRAYKMRGHLRETKKSTIKNI
jgi:ribosomal protein L29